MYFVSAVTSYIGEYTHQTESSVDYVSGKHRGCEVRIGTDRQRLVRRFDTIAHGESRIACRVDLPSNLRFVETDEGRRQTGRQTNSFRFYFFDLYLPDPFLLHEFAYPTLPCHFRT